MRHDVTFCNKCGKELTFYDLAEGIGIHKLIGYGSKFDGEYINVDLCLECFDKFLDSLAVDPTA